jgi:hypothetical protein
MVLTGSEPVLSEVVRNERQVIVSVRGRSAANAAGESFDSLRLRSGQAAQESFVEPWAVTLYSAIP